MSKETTQMKIQEYKQQKQIKDKEHEQRSIKYKSITRQRNTFKVYMHVNKHNGRKYIGITCEPVKNRWRNGKSYKVNPHFYNAIQKYGWEDGFEHLILYENLTQQQAMNKEVELIAKYKNTKEGVYNLTDGGEHYIQTPESIAKMKETKRKNLTPERLEKIRQAAQARDFNGKKNPFYGKHHTEESKKKMSKNHWSKTNPEKFYNTVSILRKGGKNPCAKPIIRLCDGKLYSCIKECKEDNHLNADTITNYCMGKRSVFLFMYKTEYDNLSLEEQIQRKKMALDFQQNPNKYNKMCKKVICLTDNKIYNGCLECAKHYNLTSNQVSYQCRNFTKSNVKRFRQFMYLKDYEELFHGES